MNEENKPSLIERLAMDADHFRALVIDLLPAEARKRLHEVQQRGYEPCVVVYPGMVCLMVISGVTLHEVIFTSDGSRGALMHGVQADY